jgi:spermidine synthase
MGDDEDLRTLARATGPRGEVVLRRRMSGPGTSVDELIVNGAFAMDSAEISTELALARVAGRSGATVLAGGLGLGFTATELLRLGSARVDVVEIEQCLVDWARTGVTPTLGAVAADPRIRLHVADLADVLQAGRLGGLTSWDAVLLDVDNGPDFLIHPANARLYADALLAAAAGLLTPGGVLAIWCQGPAPALAEELRRLNGRVEEQLIEVERDGRQLTYAIYTLTLTA